MLCGKIFHRTEHLFHRDVRHGAPIDVPVRPESEPPCRSSRRTEQPYTGNPRQVGGMEHAGIDPYEKICIGDQAHGQVER
jgi:hypothetical protein